MNLLNSKIYSTLIVASLSLALGVSCSKGFSPMDLESSTSVDGQSDDQGAGSGGAVRPPNDRSWDDIRNKTDGAVDGWKYDGQFVIQVDAENQALVLILPLPSIFLMPVTEMPLPELPGAILFPATQPDGTSAMAVRIPLKYIIKGSSLAPYNRLPNGDALPFMPAGENRGFAIAFPQNAKYRMHLYITANAAAVFVETPDFKLPDQWAILPSLGFPVRNQDRTQVVGYFAVVANRGMHSSGVYVASRIPTSVAIMIDEILRY